MAEESGNRRDSEVSEHSVVGDIEDRVSPSLEHNKVQWQETLINLVATQQQQLAELSRRSKMATCHTPTPSCSGTEAPTAQASVVGFAHPSFKLTSCDPDKSAYFIEEWLDDAT